MLCRITHELCLYGSLPLRACTTLSKKGMQTNHNNIIVSPACEEGGAYYDSLFYVDSIMIVAQKIVSDKHSIRLPQKIGRSRRRMTNFKEWNRLPLAIASVPHQLAFTRKLDTYTLFFSLFSPRCGLFWAIFPIFLTSLLPSYFPQLFV